MRPWVDGLMSQSREVINRGDLSDGDKAVAFASLAQAQALLVIVDRLDSLNEAITALTTEIQNRLS